MDKRTIAVIGSGISGLATAWLLREHHSVTLFEADTRLGGHSHTVTVDEDDRQVAIDTGFMVFNRPNYPLLYGLFEHLGIASHPTDMSFSVSLDRGRLEYAGTGLRTLFAQPGHLVSPGFLGMLRDIVRFNRLAHALLESSVPVSRSLEAFLRQHRFGRRLRDHYLYPMAAAIWSCPRERVGQFPASSFARFFANHGLLDLRDRPTWRTPVGGASVYVDRLAADLAGRVRRGMPVQAVRRTADGVLVQVAGRAPQRFDQVVLACHADQARRILIDAQPAERALLGCVAYQPNRVLLHRDARLMPRRRSVWSSWNYLGQTDVTDEAAVSVTYWMNSLQRLGTPNDYFVSLNPLREPHDASVVAELSYSHPVFDGASMELPQRLRAVQGRDGVWYCGAWTGYGFHEDGLRSAVQVAQALGATIPWLPQLQASERLLPRWRSAAQRSDAA